MTPVPHRSTAPRAADDADEQQPRSPLRLRLRPQAPATGYVDGAWWPRSHDLTTELPALLAVLNVRLGEIPRVNYHLSDWDTAPRRIAADGIRVRLDGFWTRPAHTVDLIASDRRRLTLLLVPPDTSSAAAHEAMMRAAHRDNTDTVEDLFSSTALQTQVPQPRE
ncbi:MULTISPECIES: DUF5994 family protein [Lentzea]|uniref:Uncharacterized protein n=1 Tax=Lentzea fradiae TaxID=200378 RepID=A0A1G7WIG1_9PSEU|nr:MULTISPECIES: DUF5994 family protein [Lentzea]USX54088.1 DUF5994 family protein [Lentzea sp. HUAS12]SDG70970.1 hypothetical protein SAMN05216553_110366 [Lentzea fradiae]